MDAHAHTHMHTNTVQLIQVSFGCRRVKPEATQEEGVEMGPDPATAPLPLRRERDRLGLLLATPGVMGTRSEHI